jgi:hypothetical protein
MGEQGRFPGAGFAQDPQMAQTVMLFDAEEAIRPMVPRSAEDGEGFFSEDGHSQSLPSA